jgi:outer membrane protein OmpA-like peptidoglycan-associated protein
MNMRNGAHLALLAFWCFTISGCGIANPVSNAFNAEPRIDDDVWLNDFSSEPLSSLGQTSPQGPSSSNKTLTPGDTGYIPSVCNPSDADSKNKEQGDQKVDKVDIVKCTEAMKQLIDVRFAHYEDSIMALAHTGNTIADVGVIGLGTASALSPGGTSQILGAISAAITGTKGKIDQDILYNKSIELIVTQMEKDRTSWASIIERRLYQTSDKNSYSDMYQAANDLYAYARAGSWSHALISMETDSGAQNASCQKELKDTKSGVAGSPSDPSNGSLSATATTCNGTKAGSVPVVSADTYMIHFAESSYSIDSSPDAFNIIAEIEKSFKVGAFDSLTVAGETDSAGSPQGNKSLAESRASVVTQGLKIAGIPAAKILSAPSNLKASPAVVIHLNLKSATQ